MPSIRLFDFFFPRNTNDSPVSSQMFIIEKVLTLSDLTDGCNDASASGTIEAGIFSSLNDPFLAEIALPYTSETEKG